MKIFNCIVISFVFILTSCGNIESNNSESNNSDVIIQSSNSKVVDEGIILCEYIEPLSGSKLEYELALDYIKLEDAINLWIKKIHDLNVSYGKNELGDDILSELKVVNVHFDETTLIVEMNKSFKSFESNLGNAYSYPGYFIFGLKDFLSKTTGAKSFTIDYEGKSSEVIHPEGFQIDEIQLNN